MSSCFPATARANVDPRYHVPTRPIPRLHFPTEITPERFEQQFAAKSQPCIITGLIDDWPAFSDPRRTWRGDRWDRCLGSVVFDCSFDPVDNRIMHFGDDEGQPGAMFNPGRLRMPVWAFLEVGRIRQHILEARASGADVSADEQLIRRLNRELTVQNVPFIDVDENSPMQHFLPISCRVRDLVPFAFYLSHDTFGLPREMQEDLAPQSSKLIPAWGTPDSSRIWVASGGVWKAPFPPWSDKSVPQPTEDQSTYSCFHCDRMENFHSLLAGEKEVVLVPPGQRDVLRATRYSTQNQWLAALVPGTSGSPHLGSTLLSSRTVMDFQSDQSSVHPFRSPESNRRVTRNSWPDAVDFPVNVGRLVKGDTLYIPAYHWHWVATTTPPALGLTEDGALAMSVNFWWWPVHNDDAMERWSFQNEVHSWANRRVDPKEQEAPVWESHRVSFRNLTLAKRQEAKRCLQWPQAVQLPTEFEIVD